MPNVISTVPFITFMPHSWFQLNSSLKFHFFQTNVDRQHHCCCTLYSTKKDADNECFSGLLLIQHTYHYYRLNVDTDVARKFFRLEFKHLWLTMARKNRVTGAGGQMNKGLSLLSFVFTVLSHFCTTTMFLIVEKIVQNLGLDSVGLFCMLLLFVVLVFIILVFV